MTGRPSAYTADIAVEIFERLTMGESLREICRDDHMPGQTTVYRWLAENRGGFREQYAHARAMQADHYMDEMIEIADGVRSGPSQTSVRAAKLAIEARKWTVARLMPKKYGR